MDKKPEEKKMGAWGRFWYRFWYLPDTVSEPWMTDEELMNSPSVKDFFENGDAAKMLKIIEKNNRQENRKAV